MFEKVEFTNMCMICDGSRVVVIDRKKKDWPGVTFPGGHISPGESFTDAVIREVQEETGLNIYSPPVIKKLWIERLDYQLSYYAKLKAQLENSTTIC